MPPKPQKAAPSKKADAKKKEKVIEDKTFGLKNKKGAKQQKFIQQVEKQVKSGGVPARKADEPKKTDKESKMKEQKEMALLFKPVQKVEKGADPKTILCAFYKQGQCSKGSKCKFSHDISLERKAEKRSIYVDIRDDGGLFGEDEEEDGESKGKEGALMDERNRPTTDIICKYFLDAVENSKYGWFWACPNGTGCIYRHALPKGFVLKKDKKKDDKKEEISLEDLIERERAALASKSFTKITLESFLSWKKRKLKEKKEAAAKEEEKKRSDFKAGRHIGLSGREMFYFNPELAKGDQTEDGSGEAVVESYSRSGGGESEDEEEEVNYNDYEDGEEREHYHNHYREIYLDLIETEAQEVDGTGTQAPDLVTRFTEPEIPLIEDEEKTGVGEASGIAINENLFIEDDLEELEQELEELELEEYDEKA